MNGLLLGHLGTRGVSLLGEINPDDMPEMILFGGGILVAIVAIVAGSVRSVSRTRAREHTRREVAAYVAEGSMTPADAERILKADPPDAGGCCGSEK